MVRQPVNSSSLVSVGYDDNAQVLEIEFDGGRVYRYLSLPSSIYEGLMAATSHGKFFNQYIKDKFACEQVR